MAFPITRSAFAGSQGTNSTSWTLTYPGAGDILDGGGSAIVSGDLIMVNISRDGSAGTGAISGYSSLFDQAASGSVARGLTFVKIADGTESGTFAYTPGASEQGVWRVAVIKNWHGTISGGVEASSAATGANTTPDPPSFSPSWGSADTFWRAVFAADDGRPTVSAYPTNFDIYPNDDKSNGSGGACMGSAGRQNATATEDPGTFTRTGTGSSSGWVAWVVAVRPSSVTTVQGSFTANAIIKKTVEVAGSSTPPVLSATTNEITYNNATTFTFTKPAGVVAGDVIFAVLTASNPPTRWIAPQSGGSGDGWHEEVVHAQDTGPDATISLWWKIAGGSEPSTYDFVTDAGSETGVGWMGRISGSTYQRAVSERNITDQASATTAWTTGSVLPGQSNSLLVAIAGSDGLASETAPNWTHDSAAGWTEVADFHEALSGHMMGVAYKAIASPASTSHAWTKATNGTGLMALLAIAPSGGSAPVFESDTETSFASGSTNVVVTKPTGTAQGDLLVVAILDDFIEWDPQNSGFTEIGMLTSAAADQNRMRIAVKTAGASEPASYTFTFDSNTMQGLCWMGRFSGARANLPPVTNTATNSMDTIVTTWTSASITPSNANSLLVAAATADGNSGHVSPQWSSNNGWPEYADFRDEFTFQTIGIHAQSLATPTSTSHTWTKVDADQGPMFITAVRPVVTPGGITMDAVIEEVQAERVPRFTPMPQLLAH